MSYIFLLKMKITIFVKIHLHLDCFLFQIEIVKENEQINLKNALENLKLKDKTLAVLSKDENIERLQAFIKNANQRLNELTTQYKRVKHPLLEEYEVLQNTLYSIQTEHQEELNKLVQLRELHKNLTNSLKEKAMLESALTQKFQQICNGDKR